MNVQTSDLEASLRTRRRGLLLHGLLVFAVTGGLALLASAQTVTRGSRASSDALAVPYALGVIALGTVVFMTALRWFRSSAVFQLLFALIGLAGTWLWADAWLPPGPAILFGSAAILSRALIKRIFYANFCLALGLAGLISFLAPRLSSGAALVLLTVVSFYDMLAVHGTGHMVALFHGLAARGAVFAFALVPLDLGALQARFGSDSRGVAWLGAGDVALPVLLAASSLRLGFGQAVLTLAGALLGLGLLFRIARNDGRSVPTAGLPPIALGAILAHLASLIIFSP